MLCFLFSFSLSNSVSVNKNSKGFNTFYSQVSTISGDLFLKLLASGEIKYFMNIPMFRKDFDFISNTEFRDDEIPFHQKSNNDLLTNLMFLSPSILTFFFYRFVEFFKTHKIIRIGSEEEREYEEIQNNEKEHENDQINDKKIFKSLELSEYDEYHNKINYNNELNINYTSGNQSLTSKKWNCDEWDKEEEEKNQFFSTSFNQNENSRNVFHEDTINNEINISLERAKYLEQCFESKERSSLLVNTKWF